MTTPEKNKILSLPAKEVVENIKKFLGSAQRERETTIQEINKLGITSVKTPKGRVVIGKYVVEPASLDYKISVGMSCVIDSTENLAPELIKEK